MAYLSRAPQGVRSINSHLCLLQTYMYRHRVLWCAGGEENADGYHAPIAEGIKLKNRRAQYQKQNKKEMN